MAWAIVAFVCGLWWSLAAVWRLLYPSSRTPLWLALTRDLVPAPLVGLLVVHILR